MVALKYPEVQIVDSFINTVSDIFLRYGVSWHIAGRVDNRSDPGHLISHLLSIRSGIFVSESTLHQNIRLD